MENTSLSIIQKNPEKYTMLIPIETVSQIPEIMAPTIKAVKISTDLNDKEIYVQEKARDSYNGRPGSPARYAITKKGLTKLAEAAGIKQIGSESVLPSICQKCVSVNQNAGKIVQCGNCGSNKDIRYKVTIAVPQLTGETLYFTDHHEISVNDAMVGMTENQAKEFLKHRAQICEAKALNGAIRTALQIKGSYLIEEFKKPFVVGYLVPNLDNEAVKRVAIESMFQSRGNLFGRDQKKNPMETPMIGCVHVEGPHEEAQLDYRDVIEAVDSVPAQELPKAAPPSQVPKECASEQSQQPIEYGEEDRSMDFCCEKCSAVITENVWNYSFQKYGQPLCMKCQRIVRSEQGSYRN